MKHIRLVSLMVLATYTLMLHFSPGVEAGSRGTPKCEIFIATVSKERHVLNSDAPALSLRDVIPARGSKENRFAKASTAHAHS